MQKKLRRLFSLALAAVMLLSLVGCGAKSGTGSQGGSETIEYPEWLNLESAIPIVKEGTEDKVLDVWVMRDGLASELENSWSYKYMTEVLNVQMNITPFTSANRDELLSAAFGANELPDVIIGAQSYLDANRLVTYGALDQQLVDLAPYINETLMPNLYGLYEDEPGYRAAVTDSDGHVWSFGLITYDDRGTVMKREYLNYEWLDKLNLEEPETIDELLDVLRAFKKDNPNSYPLGATADSQSLTVLNALGYITTDNVGQEPCLRNGEVVLPISDRELYGEYIKFWKTCWDEELISRDFFASTAKDVGAQVSAGKVGFLTTGYAYSYTKDYTDFWCPGPLTSSYNTTKQWPASPSALTCGGFVITSACDKELIPLACRFADVLYNRHNYNLFNMGPNTTAEADYLFGNEGWSYKALSDGTFETVHHGFVNNPDKYANLNEYLWRVNRIWYAGTWGMHAYDGSEDFLGYVYSTGLSDPSTVTDTSEFRLEKVNGKTPEGADHAARSANYELTPYVTRDMYPSIAYYDTETTEEIASLKIQVNQYATAEFANFVTGKRALTEEELTKYFNEIDNLGAARLVEIYTEYYEGYVANKG